MIHLIKNDPAYESNKKILLVSCNTGNKSKAPRSYTVFAQKLADYLGEGSVVIAPNAYARVWNTGELGVDHDGKIFKENRNEQTDNAQTTENEDIYVDGFRARHPEQIEELFLIPGEWETFKGRRM